MPDTANTAPSEPRLLAAMDATWPSAEQRELEGWRLHRGLGGGKRVSAAQAQRPGAEIAAAEAAMRDWDQPPLFRLTPGEAALDSELDARGYAFIDPVVLYIAPVAALKDDRDETARVIRADLPVAVMREVWAAGGIGPGRLAVMERAAGPRAYLMARKSDRCAGVAFTACDGNIAMIHAIEVSEHFRRQGAGRDLVIGAANWAAEQGAEWLGLAVTEANAGARALYRALGMSEAAHYHYRIIEGEAP